MPVKRLKEFLDHNKVKYVTIAHSLAYTAQEIAALTHIKGRELAKTVMVKLDGKLAMTVLPASEKVELELLEVLAGVGKAEIATEADFANTFPDCELGAMPPFGNLWGIPVYVAKHLAEDEEIAFNAGSHTELIRMSYADFESIVQPRVLDFSAFPAST